MEKSINKAELSGFAGMDPEVKTLKNGARLMRFTLATSRSYKTKTDEWARETTWHNIVLWNSNAEKALLHIRKGSFVKLEGKIVNRQYADEKGVKHFVSEIAAYAFEVIEIEKTAELAKAA